MIDIHKPQSVIVPFVGTLNDNDVASPVIYWGADNIMRQVLEETPAIAQRKECMQQYLRYLPARYLGKEKLMMNIFCITKNERNIDSENVASLVQNAGNKIIWNDDSQIFDVRCQRYASKIEKDETERLIIYILAIRPGKEHEVTYRQGLSQLISKDYREKYDMEKHIKEIFDLSGRIKFCSKGFWRDDRFLKIPALAVNYQKWLMKEQDENSLIWLF